MRMETGQQHLRYKYDRDGKSDGETGAGGGVSQAGFPLHGSSGPMFFFFFSLKWHRSDRKREHVK